MSKGPARFTESDVRRAIKGALAAGLYVTGVRVDGGGVTILTTAEAPAPAPAPDHEKPEPKPADDTALW